MKVPELLCPAGSFESFKAAVDNGADAVYFGGSKFNARNAAANFSEEEIFEAIDYAHSRGAKANITINTLYKDSEIDSVLEFAEKMYCNGADAFILQDIGVFSKIKEYMPGIQLHASTQMTIHSLAGAQYLQTQGFDRVVLSRELSLEEVAAISNHIDMETEVFVHGALCVCYSGQCLMSSHIGGRSGNRGRCAQPCRQAYSLEKAGATIAKGFLLSPRDMINLENIDKLRLAGVSTLKIEGRMKSPEYVALVTKAYREQLDRVQAGETDVDYGAVKSVTQIFNRGGASTSGYYENYAGKKMMSMETSKSTGTYLGRVHGYAPSKQKDGLGRCTIRVEDSVAPGDGVEIRTASQKSVGGYISKEASFGEDILVYINGDIHIGDKVYKSFDKKLSDSAKNLLTQSKKQMEITGAVKALSGQPVEMSLECGGICVKIVAGEAQKAQNQPMSGEKIIGQLSKTGSTPYKIAFHTIEIGDDVYIPVSLLNELRRNCIDAFHEKYRGHFKREQPSKPIRQNKDREAAKKNFVKKITAEVSTAEQLKAAVNAGAAHVYLRFADDAENIGGLAEYCAKNGCKLYISLPKVCRQYEESELTNLVQALENTGIAGYLVSTYGELHIIGAHSKKEIITDYSFSVFNSLSYKFFKSQGILPTVSTELNIEEMKHIGNSEMIIHGNLPLMVTHQCPVGLYAAGKEEGRFCKLKNNAEGYALGDKTGQKFPVVTDCNRCYALILNGPKLTMLNKFDEIDKTNGEFLRLIFWEETPEDIFDTVMDYIRNAEGSFIPTEKTGITYGHFFRGVL